MNDSEVDLRNRAIDALKMGNLHESEALFRKLLGSSEMDGQALAGIGMIRLTQGDDVSAGELFQNALKRGPDADALYGLGVLAERAGNNQQAFNYQLQALQVNSDHGGARNRLEALQKLAFSNSHPAPSTPPPTAPTANSGASAFEVILTGDEKQARDQALAFLQRFRMKRRPRLSAYFGSLVSIVGLLALAITVVTARQIATNRNAARFQSGRTVPSRPAPRLPHPGGHP